MYLQTAMAVGTVLDFFASATPVIAGGPVQAQIFVGTQTVTTSGQISFTLATTSLTTTQDLVATATSPNGDTSAFSVAEPVTGPSPSAASVTSTADTDTAGTLRAAIDAANNDKSPLPDLITFAITGSGPFVINLSSPLIIQHPVILDAATQPGYLGTPVVVLAGGNKISDGLVLASLGGTTIEGLGIVGFTHAGIDIESGGNLVVGNDIGGAAGGNGIGVLIDASNNTIGGTTGGAANVITHNTQEPVEVASGNGNAIRGNLMYSNGTGPPAGSGIVLVSGANDGLSAPMDISATNDGGRISVSGLLPAETTSGTFLLDFYTYQPGGAPAQGYFTTYSVPVTAGAKTPFLFPVPGYLSDGLSITATVTAPDGSTSIFSVAARVTGHSQYNVTNTAASGDGSLASAIADVIAHPSQSRLVPDVITFSITEGTIVNGIYVIDLGSTSLTITVPVTIDATSQSPSYDGTPLVEIIGGGLVLQAGQDGTTGSNGSTIEGLDIVNSGGAGIIVESRGDTIVNDVLGINLSGTTASSGAPLGPETSGVAIDGGADATIGGTTGLGNIIGANSSAGVSITGSSATGNVVAGNLIGTNLGGVALGNGEGIIIDGGASINVIGGSSAATANVIEFNGTGILISDPTTADNLVAANFIGTNSAGATTTGNVIGISIADGASGNLIGGIGSGNTIGGNTSAGVSISGTTGGAKTRNVVSGNFIGVNAVGAHLGNGKGVVIDDASDNTIGGTTSGAGNTIAYNTGPAVEVDSGSGNAIREDLIYGPGPAIVVAPGATTAKRRPSSSPRR